MENIVKKMSEIGVIPVVKIDNPDDSVKLATSLRNGGLNSAEITFRTDAAEESIRRISKAYPDMLIVAGTVLTTEQADKAIMAGAKAIVSPGFNEKVVSYCVQKEYSIIPGVCTPSEIENAMSFGLSYLKFFPAEASGGVKMIKAVMAPYSGIKFMPTGGINASNIAEYIKCKAVFACGGSWMVPPDKIKEGKFDEIEKLTAEAVKLIKEAKKCEL